MKRTFDIILSLALLPLTIAICIPAMIAIRLETPGSTLFFQARLGRDKRPFKVLKLRTMAQGTPQAGSHEVSSTQITRVGHLLRRTKIDELPQIFNVLAGAMSFVGPRPNLPNQHELIEERSRRRVYDVRPGITGLAQLSGIDMSTPVKLAEVDANYIASQSLSGDLKLILRTAAGTGSGDAAERS
jgi:lipopolysaccharide/colanic/teichoic acid biosynthesis glycosyltransferase